MSESAFMLMIARFILNRFNSSKVTMPLERSGGTRSEIESVREN